MNNPKRGADEIKLAVVIPAWRSRHLGAALASLRGQTDQRFRVYVGDDGSPDPIREVVRTEGAGLDLSYHRFEENQGGRDLVGHWQRCIALTADEPWIWLFADDDEAEPGCVAGFYETVVRVDRAVSLLRFNLKFIDGEGGYIRSPVPNPPVETMDELLQALLSGGQGREWRAPDHIFTREAYRQQGGFVNFPMALYSDLATWVKFAEAGGVVTIQGPELRWRAHETGTSSGLRLVHQLAILDGLAGFCDWLASFGQRHPEFRRADWKNLYLAFLCRELGRVQPPVPWRIYPRMRGIARHLADHGLRGDLRVLLSIGISHGRHWPGISSWLGFRYRRNMRKTAGDTGMPEKPCRQIFSGWTRLFR